MEYKINENTIFDEFKSRYQDFLMILNNENINNDEYNQSIENLENIIIKIQKQLIDF